MRRLPAILVLLLVATTAHAADKTTQHTLALPEGPLPITATVETQRLTTPDGKPVAEVVTTAFTHEGAGRPVTFAFNGGPGAASAWLDVGAIGPWRAPIVIPVVPSQDPTPADNPDTWLGFTDLVFIDPPGTGYSRWLGDGDAAGKPFLSVDGDIRTFATVIRRWLEAHHRLGAPVFLAGESYGGFRAPRLAEALLQQQGVGVSGLVILSPVLDFNGRDSAYDPVHVAAQIPAIVAAHRHATTRPTDAEAYAAGDYITDLLRGPNDHAAQDRIATTLAGLTGLDPALIRRRGGRIDWATVLRDQHEGQVGTPYDITLLAGDPFPGARDDNSPDALLDGLRAPISAAMLSVYQRLDWQPDGAPNRQYQLLSDSVNRAWDYGHGMNRPESMTALRQFLALDPTTRVLVVHGLYDIITPYFADALLLAQVPETTPPGRLALHAYPGGHMFYTDPQSRHALRQDANDLITAALAARAAAH
jgi:carboxypeptidase C (cathepsin A)